MRGYEMVARNKKIGRIFGFCKSKTKECTVSGLTYGYLYDIWARTCTGSAPVFCRLEAKPLPVAIGPDRTWNELAYIKRYTFSYL